MTPANRRVRSAPVEIEEERTDPLLLPLSERGVRAPTRLASAFSAMRSGAAMILGVAASLGVAWAARRHVTTSHRFAITRVEVTGNERRAAEAIVAESGLVFGANVFSTDLDAARARLMADPWIADAKLTRRLPGTILVQTTERKAAALVAAGDTFLASADGELFKRLEPGDPIDLPLVTGLTVANIADDREEAKASIVHAIDIADEYAQGPLSRHSPLEEVHLDPGGGLTLVVGHNPVQLVLGRAPFRRKLEQAARVFSELEKRRAKAQAVLLDSEVRPDRVVVRLR